MAIDPRTSLGPVNLTVQDLDRAATFYERAVGLESLDRANGTALLGAGGVPLVELTRDPDAPPRAHGTTGLYHLAILVPDRAELARSLRRLVETRWPLSGASDHLVSEALYLSDTEGNGIEIYRDRPREEWRYDSGELQMATLPLDLADVARESDGARADRLAPGTRMGHVHLQVHDLAEAERFYSGLLGFDVTVRGYPGALFVSAGGYHHHVGLNTWAGEGAPRPPAGSAGLRWFEVRVPNEERMRIVQLLEAANVPTEDSDDGTLAADPSGNRVLLSSPR